MTKVLFSDMSLSPKLERAVSTMGFDFATPIQSEAIPVIRTGVDVIARSQTGTQCAPVASLANGGFNLSLDGLFDVISGDAKKKKRLYEYEKMENSVKNIKNYLGEDYFIRLKVPKDLIDNFLQFVYTSDNLNLYTDISNYEAVKISIEKYLPIYQKRLRNSNLQNIIVNN